ncbi:MAG TPA: DNA-directed RNA polymerase subunit alpha [Lentisphaeria bacterium]|nr:MAG: DNA-directed RNA polymerase subunit alpha [Lentisphaerae bacterium GWF2_49_21]HBC89747.1 DNA-directed RNA polymerase subunit alpha [Lentisphaeria bacterium]
MPRSVELDESTATPTYGKFTAAPLQRGFAHSIGNSLRRILLSSLEGSAISAIRIDGASHEFTTLPNIIEDVTDIVLNLKRIRINCTGDLPKTLEIKKDKPGQVTAADIVTDGTVEILNPDQLICTLDKKGSFHAEVEIIKGRGYFPAEKNKKADHPLGTIPIDSLFSPVTHVRYNVGTARVGEETEMDSLILEIWSDGRITPRDALEKAAKILQDHLRPFLGSLAGEEGSLAAISEEEQKLYKTLVQPVDNIELSVRAQNCLNNANIKLIGELCLKSESKMLKFRNFGRKSLEEIKQKLSALNLSLGMTFSEEMVTLLQAEAEKLKAKTQEEE